MTIKDWLIQATETLTNSDIHSARLDALILLEGTLQRDRSWILAHDDQTLSPPQAATLSEKLTQRSERIPMAYIRGYIEFYGRQFEVTPDTLIPRPETEEMIELALSLPLPDNSVVIDVGTGSGCIAISLKSERPEWTVTATDISSPALSTARNNSQHLCADINLVEHSLLSHPTSDLSTLQPNLIAANLPYVAHGYEMSPEAYREPAQALFAADHGYELIETLLPQAAGFLAASGYLLLESDPWQQDRIINQAIKHGFLVYTRKRFHLALQLRSSS